MTGTLQEGLHFSGLLLYWRESKILHGTGEMLSLQAWASVSAAVCHSQISTTLWFRYSLVALHSLLRLG